MNCKMKILFPLTLLLVNYLTVIQTSTATLDIPSGSNNSTSATPDIPGQLKARNGTL